MGQGTLFAGIKTKGNPAPSVVQTGLPFTGFTVSGRRGEIHAVWLDDVLARLRSTGASVPTLTQLQARWDARRTAEQAARDIVAEHAMAELTSVVRDQIARLHSRPVDAPVVAPVAPMLALPSPAVRLSQRQAAKLAGMPISTYRRRLAVKKT